MALFIANHCNYRVLLAASLSLSLSFGPFYFQFHHSLSSMFLCCHPNQSFFLKPKPRQLLASHHLADKTGIHEQTLLFTFSLSHQSRKLSSMVLLEQGVFVFTPSPL